MHNYNTDIDNLIQPEFMPNYLEYSDLFDDWTRKELDLAWACVNSSELQDDLYSLNSPLLAFLVDTDLQDKLHLFQMDVVNERLKNKYV